MAQGMRRCNCPLSEPFEGAIQGAVAGTQSGTLFLQCSVVCTFMRGDRRNKIRNTIFALFRELHLYEVQ